MVDCARVEPMDDDTDPVLPLGVDADEVARLRPSPDMPALIDVKDSAVQRLVRRTVVEAEQLVSEIMLAR